MPGTVVMGVIFVDIKGLPVRGVPRHRHQFGQHPLCPRRWARNVAEDMARIGSPVTFVTLGDTTPHEPGGDGAAGSAKDRPAVQHPRPAERRWPVAGRDG